MISQDDIEKIKAIPILEIAERLGIVVKNNKAFCFTGHDRKTPSLSFLPSSNIWTCFGCGLKGDSIKLVMQVLSIDFLASVEWLASEFSIRLSVKGNSPSIYKTHRTMRTSTPKRSVIIDSAHSNNHQYFDIYTWIIDNLSTVFTKNATDYMKAHAISQKTIIDMRIKQLHSSGDFFMQLKKAWPMPAIARAGLVKLLPNNEYRFIWPSYSIVFPFIENDFITYLQARTFSGHAKYINLIGIEKPVYNLAALNSTNTGDSVYICEGIPDTLALISKNKTAIGILGASSFNDNIARLLLSYRIAALPDGDLAGSKMAEKIKDIFAKYGKDVTFFKLPKDHDVADVLCQGENDEKYIN